MKLFPVGTRSVLYGVHAFWFHPLTVGLAWHKLFRVWPTWREWVCIFVHDLGYWGRPNMDGPEGRRHPEFGAQLARKVLGESYGQFTLYHSREYAKMAGAEPSPLAWADKFSLWCEPRWFYLLRARLSGEITEYRRNAPAHTQRESDAYWHQWLRTKFRNINEIRALLRR
jgi:hypothetical protein